VLFCGSISPAGACTVPRAWRRHHPARIAVPTDNGRDVMPATEFLSRSTLPRTTAPSMPELAGIGRVRCSDVGLGRADTWRGRKHRRLRIP